MNKYGENLDPVLKKNLDALVEIRDNSIHFHNKDFELKKNVLEIGAASLKNYASLSQKWFGADLSRYNFFIMPLGFVRDLHTAECVSLNSNEKKFLGFIEKLRESVNENDTSDYALSLEVELKIKRKSNGAEVKISNSTDAIPIRLVEENVLEKFPWDYKNLTAYLNNRFQNFKCNQKYHKIRKELENNTKYCLERLLDPTNSDSSKKRFYNPNIIKEFDKHYSKK